MPYLDKNYTKQVRKELKKRYPDFKFSVRTEDHMSLRVVIREAPFNLLSEDNDSGYEQINHYHIDEFYEDEPKKRKLLNEISSVMMADRHTVSYDMDYGSIPNYYIHLQIGEWDRPFKIINK